MIQILGGVQRGLAFKTHFPTCTLFWNKTILLFGVLKVSYWHFQLQPALQDILATKGKDSVPMMKQQGYYFSNVEGGITSSQPCSCCSCAPISHFTLEKCNSTFGLLKRPCEQPTCSSNSYWSLVATNDVLAFTK